MNNKGFTMIELIVSFTLTSIIIIFLTQIIINLKEVQEYSGIKTDLLIKQSNISNKINKELTQKKIVNIEECNDIPDYCLNFIFDDGNNSKLIVDKANKIIAYDGDKIKLIENSFFGDISVSINPVIGVASDKFDSILTLQIDINHQYFKNQSFGLYLIYQYDYQQMPIDTLNFG
ncbi:MAG: prepilin-type N-terminal cleavage/methylation domain-containing protein [Bacilli bacterium]